MNRAHVYAIVLKSSLPSSRPPIPVRIPIPTAIPTFILLPIRVRHIERLVQPLKPLQQHLPSVWVLLPHGHRDHPGPVVPPPIVLAPEAQRLDARARLPVVRVPERVLDVERGYLRGIADGGDVLEGDEREVHGGDRGGEEGHEDVRRAEEADLCMRTCV